MLQRTLILLFVACLTLTACSDTWLGESNEKKPLAGERVSVLPKKSVLNEPLTLDVNETCIPPMDANTGNSVAGSRYLSVKKPLREAWRREFGQGSTNKSRLLSRPIVASGIVYTIDTDGIVLAMSANTGDILWRAETRPDDEDEEIISGELAYDRGFLIVATGYAEVLALDARNGQVVWRKTVASPVRATPSIYDGRVYVLSADNKLDVLDLISGTILWSHEGSSDIAGVLGGSKVAVGGSVVVAPYSTGEIYALKAENGRILWAENLTALKRAEGTASISDILAWPVIDDNEIFAMSMGGTMAAINLMTGRRIWDARIGGSQTPTVAGQYLYVVTGPGFASCMARKTGKILWIRDMNKEQSGDDKSAVSWYGPELAGERLLVISEKGEVLSLSPFDGRVQGAFQIPGQVHIPPVVANRSLFVVNDDGVLFAFR